MAAQLIKRRAGWNRAKLLESRENGMEKVNSYRSRQRGQRGLQPLQEG